MHPRHRFHLAHQEAGKTVGKGAGFTLGKIDQDVGDFGRLRGQVDAANGIGLVFGLGQPFGLGVRGAIRQRVDRCPLRIAFMTRQRIGMDRDK